jgi:16S rRNA processing protein RimM
VRGEVRVKSFTAEPLALGAYGVLTTQDGRSLEIERLRPGKGVALAKFRGVDDRNAAEALNGASLYVDRAALPPAEADEFYYADLIGLAAVAPSGETLGTVAAIHDFGAGDILEIVPKQGRAMLIPFTRASVPDIDVAHRRLTVVRPIETSEPGKDPKA